MRQKYEPMIDKIEEVIGAFLVLYVAREDERKDI